MNGPTGSTLARWLPPVLWAAIILASSNDLFSASHSGVLLRAILTFLLGAPPEPEVFATIHFAARKCVHLIAYGVLGALWFRAQRRVIPSAARDPEAQRPRPQRLGIPRAARDDTGWRQLVLACALATLVAVIDEAHQATLKSRTGTPRDVAIDLVGAAIGAGLVRRVSAPGGAASPS